MSATTTTPRLPTISEIDRAYHRLGQFISDLDAMATTVERFAGTEDKTFEDAMFLHDHGIAADDAATTVARRDTDPAVIARLLVLAAELEDDMEVIGKYATRLREDVITSYREYVIERRAYRAQFGGDHGS